jgi:hypothetical protein
MQDTIRRMFGSHMSWQSADNLVGDLNRRVRGWMNYFSYGSLWQTYGQLERHIQQRVRGWLVTSTESVRGANADIPRATFTTLLRVVQPTAVLAKLRKH